MQRSSESDGRGCFTFEYSLRRGALQEAPCRALSGGVTLMFRRSQ